MIGVSVDSKFSHLAWCNTPRKEGGLGKIRYPIASDLTKKISQDYGVLLEGAGISLRGLFLIDKNGVVRHSVVNDLPLGRSVPEAIRVLDALQHHESHGEVCPANWHKGEQAMKPTAAGAKEWFSSKHK